MNAWEIKSALSDLGCGEEVIERAAALYVTNHKTELLRLLAKLRGELLDEVHRNEEKIGCIDYLVYGIKKKESLSFGEGE